MADPLSVAASIVGLIAAAAKVVGILSKVKTSMANAPESLMHLHSQIQDFQTCLSAFDRLISAINEVPRERGAMIQVDQLIATLTEAVLTFSELNALVIPLDSASEIYIKHRVAWAWKEDEVSKIMARIDRHKSSLSLMLNIATCLSDLEAQQSSVTLHEMVQDILQSNQDLSARLRRIENNYETESVVTTCYRNGYLIEDDGLNSQRVSKQTVIENPTNFMDKPFEVDLGTSRVYRRTQLYKSDVSYTSSATRTHVWSIFTGLSLSQISNISALALPVFSNIIGNNEDSKFIFLESPGERSSRPVYLDRNIALPVQDLQSLEVETGNVAEEKDSQDLAIDEDELLEQRCLQTPSPATVKRTLGSGSLNFKVLVLGEETSGKSELVRDFPLFSDSRERILDIGGSNCSVEVKETVGFESYVGIIDQWIRESEAFVLVYSITSRLQFSRILGFHAQVQRIKQANLTFEQSCAPSPTPFVLVGSHCDLTKVRKVSETEGRALGKEIGCSYLEALRHRIDADNVFLNLVKVTIQRRLDKRNQEKARLRVNPSRRGKLVKR